MKQTILIFVALLLSITSKGQAVKSFDCIKIREDSSVATYSAKVTFKLSCDEDKRLDLVKLELEKTYHITTDKIISLKSFIGKRHRTYLYEVKVAKK